jgi:hypothetical protein
MLREPIPVGATALMAQHLQPLDAALQSHVLKQGG